MRYVTVLGAGLLVGTALAVIIPEGVHALYLSELETNQLQTQHESHSDHKIAGRHLNHIDHDVKDSAVRPVRADKVLKDDVLPPAHEHTADRPREFDSDSTHKHSDTTHSAIGETRRQNRAFPNSASFSLGVTLILGFVFMLIIDNCGSRLVHSHGNQSRMFSVRWHANTLRCLLSVLDSSGALVISKPKASWTATLGLVVHAAADGIALGNENWKSETFDSLSHAFVDE